jgi:hypothetical protein
MATLKTSRAAAIAAKCRDCIYDPLSAGRWREQVAACTADHCALFAVRPVPRACIAGGMIDAAAVTSLRTKLDGIDRSRSKCR